jgi:opacity protein-like surface antigen
MNRVFVGFAICAALPVPASAQWHVGAYAGAASTHPAAITVRPAAGRAPVHLERVTFRGESFDAPIYYGYRVGRDIGARGWGVEGEFIHLKVIANEASLRSPVDAFAMTHGLNFLLANVVWTGGGAGRLVRWAARAGVGPTLPHAESRVAGRAREGYDWGGVGLHLAPGLEVRVTDRLRATGEYKFTFARPVVRAAGGTIATTVRTHHLAFGLAVVF